MIMITLYKKRDSQFGDEVREKLNDLVVSYEEKELPDGGSSGFFIMENEKKIEGRQPINEWLTQLDKELSWQRSLSGDGCYIDPETGETC